MFPVQGAGREVKIGSAQAGLTEKPYCEHCESACKSLRRRFTSMTKPHVVEHVEFFVDPAYPGLVPPRILIIQRHPRPAIQGGFQAMLILGVVAPVEQAQQFVPRERNFAVGKVALPRQLNQAQQHFLVQRCRQAKGIGAGDG